MPDASLEFSLLDELSLLFRMLACESGHACQATNLLRALRQSREATGLGLLEGHAQKGAHGADIEVFIFFQPLDLLPYGKILQTVVLSSLRKCRKGN